MMRIWISIGVMALAAQNLSCAHCANETLAPDESAEQSPVVRNTDDPFARAIALAGESPATVQSTALIPAPIDAKIVEQIVQQRMGQVTRLALQDTLKAARAQGALGRPIQDFAISLSGLVAEVSDAETRSQTVTAALARDAIAVGIASLVDAHLVPDLNCKPDHLATAAYEGLAASTFLRRLAFPLSTGTVTPDCVEFSAFVARLVDTLGTVGLDVARLDEVSKRFTAAEAACAGTTLDVAPELKSSVARAHELDLRALRDMKIAFRRSRAQLTSVSVDCLAKLDDFSAQFDPSMESLGALSIKLGTVRAAVEKVRENIFKAAIRSPLVWAQLHSDPAQEIRAFLAVNASSEAWDQLGTMAQAFVDCAHLGSRASFSLRGLYDKAQVTAECPGGGTCACAEQARTFAEHYDETAKRLIEQLPIELQGKSFDALDESFTQLAEIESLLDPTTALANLQPIINACGGTMPAAVTADAIQTARACASVDVQAITSLDDAKRVAAQCGITNNVPAADAEVANFRNAAQQRIDGCKKAIDSAVTLEFVALRDQLLLGLGDYQKLQPLIVSIVQRQPFDRAQLVSAVQVVKGVVDEHAEKGALRGPLKDVIVASLDALPQAVREDKSNGIGVRLDVAALATGIATRYIDSKRPGFYLRATVGVGYLWPAGDNPIVPTVHEEIGVGYRWQPMPQLLHGPHLMASGLLFQVIPSDQTKGSLLVAAGYSFNLYRLLELSINIGPRWHHPTDAKGWMIDWPVIASVQIPLADYFTALADNGSATVTPSGNE